ncbi:MAG TPA: efflux RND transporter periplasmic adaptor subunit [Longimicrobiales bacterium]
MFRSKAVTLIGIALTLSAAGCKAKPKSADAAEEKPIVLGAQDVAAVQRAQINTGSVLTGSLQPAWVVSVKAQVPGTVASISVDRGVPVRQGQVLAVLRAEGIRGQAEGARAGVAAARAGLAVAEQRLESARTLRQAGAMSEIDFKAAAAGYEAARAQLAAARAAAAGASEAEGHATVRAPITGVVGMRSVETGESVSPGDELFTVVRSDVLELSGQVPVAEATAIRPGQLVSFTLDAYPGRTFNGEVSRVEPMANADTRQVGVYVRMRNPGGLVGGTYASGRIETNTIKNALVIPESSVRSAGGVTSVLAIENGRVAKRIVTLGARDPASGTIEVRSGLRAGEFVVAVSGASITEGARVQVGSAAPATKAAGPGKD